jgi:hypothetical protein
MLWNPHGPDSLAIALLVWMVADVPATNVFGSDASRMRSALFQPRALLSMLHAKAIALWALAMTICIPIDVLSGLRAGRSAAEACAIAIALALIPLSILGLAGFVGAAFPYHPIALRDRYATDRRNPRRLVRWAVLVTLPYMLVPALGQLAVLGFLALEHLCSVSVRHTSSVTAVATLVVAMAALTYLANVASGRCLLYFVARRSLRLGRELEDGSL